MTRTGAPVEAVAAVRQPAGTGIVVRGTVPKDTSEIRTDVAVRNNTAYFVTVLRETLIAAGIRVDGAAVDQDDLPEAEHSVHADTVFAEFLGLVRGEGSAALVATHNERLAAKMDRVLRLHEGLLG